MPLPKLRAAVAALVALLLAGCGQAYYRAINLGVDDSRIGSQVYAPAQGLSLDIHRPADGAGPAPVVVFLHGGSWRNGDRQGYRFVGQRLAAGGALVLVPDYRKAPAHAFPDFMHDTARALAWARTHAAELGGDPDRIYVMGHSAGAHIAALVATDARYLAGVDMKPRDLAGVIALAGPFDFLPITDPALREVFGDEADWPASQPVNFVDGDEPPFLLLHGTDDGTVWPVNSQRLGRRLVAQGVSATYVPVPDKGHIGLLLELRGEKASPTLREVLAWLDLPAEPSGLGRGDLGG
ncbi:alpha/beta hydrolase [Arenimonas sp. MALMAid1274]|uniref:alpha/beta hydrolase n=1 Tax=Arenimonas sp. MALMAid1274 TaxID=3411630 RepID=UPI003B9F2A6E